MKLVLIKDLDGNEITINPTAIVNVVENLEHVIVETKDGILITNSSKKIIDNAIQNCYLT